MGQSFQKRCQEPIWNLSNKSFSVVVAIRRPSNLEGSNLKRKMFALSKEEKLVLASLHLETAVNGAELL